MVEPSDICENRRHTTFPVLCVQPQIVRPTSLVNDYYEAPSSVHYSRVKRGRLISNSPQLPRVRRHRSLDDVLDDECSSTVKSKPPLCPRPTSIGRGDGKLCVPAHREKSFRSTNTSHDVHDVTSLANDPENSSAITDLSAMTIPDTDTSSSTLPRGAKLVKKQKLAPIMSGVPVEFDSEEEPLPPNYKPPLPYTITCNTPDEVRKMINTVKDTENSDFTCISASPLSIPVRERKMSKEDRHSKAETCIYGSNQFSVEFTTEDFDMSNRTQPLHLQNIRPKNFSAQGPSSKSSSSRVYPVQRANSQLNTHVRDQSTGPTPFDSDGLTSLGTYPQQNCTFVTDYSGPI